MNDSLTTPRPDRLTIARLMVLTAFVGLGLMLFVPDDGSTFNYQNPADWRTLASTIAMGLSLPGLVYVLAEHRRRHEVGLGGLLWLMLALGALLMMPPVIKGRLDGRDGMAFQCLLFVMPLASLWFVCARLLAKKLSARDFYRDAAWTERFGLNLGIAWSILGLWILGEFYWQAFSG